MPFAPWRRTLRWTTLAAAGLGLAACSDEPLRPTAAAPPAPATDIHLLASLNQTYTTDADFNQGTLVNLNYTAPNANQLQLNTSSGTFPFIWIALSQRCTIAKINTQTGQILGEYRTVGDAAGCNQSSRTTVAIDGSVWVGHRGPGGVTHVGLAELNQCIDRNGNGTIETSTGYADVLAWSGDESSAATNAQDECILHHVYTGPYGFWDTRHMSIDRNNKLWVGDYSSKGFIRVNGTTGAVETPTAKVMPCGGYGGLIDGNGVIWSANGGGYGLLRWDPNALDVPGVNPRCIGINNYGLAVDGNGWIWATTFYGQVHKVSSDGNTVLGPFSHGSSYGQGLAVDKNGDVWVSSSLYCYGSCTVAHLHNDGSFVGNVANPNGAGSTGVSIDAAGKIWTANLNSNTATRIDPTLNGGVGGADLTVDFPNTGGRPYPYPYNYSDMTGAQLFNSTAPQGSFTVMQDGGAPGTKWGTIDWNAEPQGNVPAGAEIVVEARAADSPAGLGSQPYVQVTSGVAFDLTGQYLQVRATLKAAPSGAGPVLSDLSIRGTQQGFDLDVDLAPYSKDNVVRVSRGLLDVAILGDDDTDPCTLIAEWVFLGNGNLPDVRVAAPASRWSSCKDVNGDGFNDLYLQYHIDNLFRANEANMQTAQLVVTVKLPDGTFVSSIEPVTFKP